MEEEGWWNNARGRSEERGALSTQLMVKMPAGVNGTWTRIKLAMCMRLLLGSSYGSQRGFIRVGSVRCTKSSRKVSGLKYTELFILGADMRGYFPQNGTAHDLDSAHRSH